MAELLRIEPSKFCKGEAWFVYDDGRSYLRKVDTQEEGGRGPAIISDFIDPVLSHANGKMYDSKSGLYASYRPDGNPQGIRYECVGERVAEPFKRPPRDKNKAMQAVKRTMQEMGLE